MSARADFVIDDATRAVLSRSTVAPGSNVVVLPGQLPPADYKRVDKVLRGLGGRWDRRAKGHIFDFDPRSLVQGAAETGAYKNRRTELQLFETPGDLAERMVDLAELCPGERVLEPSAGRGAIVNALLARGVAVTAVEVDQENAKHLRSYGGVIVFRDDFLSWSDTVPPRFDAVVMNPPFARNQDSTHIAAAWSLLKVGGRLVAICSEGLFTREDPAAIRFRRWLDCIGAETEQLPAGTFRDSGTEVATRLIWATRRFADADAALPAPPPT